MKVVFSRKARLDLMAQLDWLEALSPDAALVADAAINDGLRTLAQFPAAGHKVREGEREWPIQFGRDGFIVVYVSRLIAS